MRKYFRAIFFTVIGLISVQHSFSQCSVPGGLPDSLFPVTNNFIDSVHFGTPDLFLNDKALVHKIIKKNNTYYMMGDFTNIALNRGPGIVMDSTTHEVNSYFKWRIDGVVTCSVGDGNGGFYIGGYFRKIGDSSRNYFAHINSQGQPTSFRINFNGAIEALYKRNDTLFIGGAFTSVNDRPTRLFAIYSISGDSLVTQNFNFPAIGSEKVNTIVPYGDSLFIGGSFTTPSVGLILYNIRTLSKVQFWQLATQGSSVKHVEVRKGDNTLFYMSAGDAGNNTVRAVDVNTGQQRYSIVVMMGTPIMGTDGRVYAIKRVNNKLYIAGDFLRVYDAPNHYILRNGFCSINTETGLLTGDDIQLNNSARFLALDKDKLYVSGIFNKTGNTYREHFAILDTGTLALNAWNLSPTDPLTTLSFSNGKIFTGGFFSGINSYPRDGLAAINATTSEVLPLAPDRSFEPDISGIQYADIWGDTLFVLLRTYSPLNKLVMIRLSTGERIPIPTTNFSVKQYIGVESNFLYTISDQEVRRYFLPSLTKDVTWGRIFNGINGSPFLNPRQLIMTNDKVYLIGVKSLENGLIVMDKGNSQVLNTWFYGDGSSLGGQVGFNRGVLSDSILYVAGGFRLLNNLPRHYLAAINVNNGSVTGWNTPFSVDGDNLTTLSTAQIRLHNRGLWFATLGGAKQANGQYYAGINAADTGTGVLLPPVAKADINIQGNGDYAGNVYSGPAYVGAADCFDMYFDDDNDCMIISGTFDFINGSPVTRLVKLKYNNLSAPGAANLSIAGPDTLIASADSMKYYVQNSNNTESYQWSYTGTGVEIKDNDNDTVLINVAANATAGILKVRPVNYCGVGAEITKTLAVGSVDLTITSSSLSSTSVPTGGTFTASFIETNTGNVSAGPNKIAFYLSYNNVLTPGAFGDIKLGEYLLPAGLQPASSTTLLNQALSIPCSLTPANYFLFFVADGSDSVYESNENNNAVSLPITITNGAPANPEVTVTPGTTACASQPVTLQATSPGCTNCTYSWSNGQAGQTITVTSSGVYTVTVTNSCGSAFGNRNITILPLPNVNISQNDTTICAGSTINLNASGATSYIWSPAAGLSSTATASVMASPAITTLYKVTGTSIEGCVKTDSVLITVSPQVLPSIDISFSGCPSSTIALTSTITNGGASPSIQWLANGTAVGTGANITLNNITNGTQIIGRLTSTLTCASTQTVSDTVTINCITTSIPDIDGMEKFLVGPNPVSGILSVQMKLVKIKTIDFSLSDLAGKIYYSYNAGSRIGVYNRDIDMSNLPGGVFILKVTVQSKVFSQKIVKVN